MPSVSKKQHNYMAMAQDAVGRAKLKQLGYDPPPKSVAKEYVQADKGKKFKHGSSKKSSKPTKGSRSKKHGY